MTTETAGEQPEVQESPLEDRIAEQLFGGEQADDTTEGAEEAASEAVEQAEGTEAEAAAGEALEDVEFGGKQYKLPPELKTALMAQSDYTRKTQEVADQRRMLDAQILMQQQESQFQQSVSPELQQLQILDAQLAQFRNVDWSAMDTDTMTRTKHALDQLKDQRTDVLGQIQQKRGHFDQQMQGLMHQAREKGNEYLKRNIPKWDAETQKELAVYGQREGYSDIEIGSLTDARMIKTLWKAQQWDKLQSQKAVTTKRAELAPPLQKPGASSKQTAKATQEVQYRKALNTAKSPGEKARVVQSRFEQKLFGP